MAKTSSESFWNIRTIPNRYLLGVIRDEQKDALTSASILLLCIELGPDFYARCFLLHCELVAHVDSIKRHDTEAARRGLTLPALPTRDRQTIVEAFQKAAGVEGEIKKAFRNATGVDVDEELEKLRLEKLPAVISKKFTSPDKTFARKLGIRL